MVLCIYHRNCDDGFGAAVAVRAALGGAIDYHAAQYQEEPPDVGGRDVIIVDFSYKRQVIEEMAKSARSILILDHHKTAAEDLRGLIDPPSGGWRSWLFAARSIRAPYVGAIFDMNRSGAGLAWDYFHQGVPRPPLIQYLEDRDLWHRRLHRTDEFTAALRSYPQNFDIWSGWLRDGVEYLIEEGVAIQRYYRGRVEAMKAGAYSATIDGVVCRIVNCSGFMASEVAGELSLDLPFGAIYFEIEPSRWVYSLRSTGDFDVSDLAKKFGGGGHRASAGFKSNKLVHVVVNDT